VGRPEVSVVMSAYNDAEHLPAAMAGILTQEGVDFEFVIVDDGSTDGTLAVLKQHAATDARIKVIEQPNRGLTRALIQGCAQARGDYICRQDSDDLSLPGRLAALRDRLRADAALSFVSSSAEVIGPQGEPLFVHRRDGPAEKATREFLARSVGPPGHGSVMFRRSSYQQVGGYREQLYYAQDGDLWLRLATHGRLDYVPEVLYRYRISPFSISGRLHPIKVPFADIVDELHAARLAGRSEQPILERAARLPTRASPQTRGGTSEDGTHYFIGRSLLKRSDSRSLGYLWKAIRSNPLNLRAWCFLPQAAYLRLRTRGAA